ncbi:MAG: FtsW/RodA/SpoVE family cell cycle protein [Chlamydiae bacterium]|nr:FtsW/RodA/SpoVE family cell cycle protein [Chlamydiota bacterium]
MITIIFVLMCLSLVVISSSTIQHENSPGFFSPSVMAQLRSFILGWVSYFVFAWFDYRNLKKSTPIFYAIILILLVGLFFTNPIQNVHRWFRLPFLPFALQPSEFAKVVSIMMLSWYFEDKYFTSHLLNTGLKALLIILIPFILVLKQPDLGTSLILLPICYTAMIFANAHKGLIRWMTIGGTLMTSFVLLIFGGMIPYEKVKGPLSIVLKEYQIERLNPYTYHQKAGQTAIALGGIGGSGFGKSQFTGQEWLPFAHTDSIFPAFTEEFGVIGAAFLFALFFSLIYLSLKIAEEASDRFAKLYAACVATYIAVHVIVNISMMAGSLPITGVPLILMTYGGSSVVATMVMLGLLQSITVRRFRF